MTDTASTQLLPTYIPSLPERLNNLEALLADRTHRQAPEQRAVILERNDIVRDLLLRGETLAHIGRVLNIQRERVRQIKDSLPPEVRERHAQVRNSIAQRLPWQRSGLSSKAGCQGRHQDNFRLMHFHLKRLNASRTQDD